ncbi:HET-domain-containing protein [Amniculicola lignicola CBS 123094]|uniref:HET-domain-containing protein n=1 Tax=Amniculicola lignicola CBS 123094 TaxID=1392246 RepID=A0A6A5WQE4_9PLEO|nr:HET-domain-containing protein [Amniculicola lignicola CBS 123094]
MNDKCFALLNRWMETCLRNQVRCQYIGQKKIGDFKPTRLFHLRDGMSHVRLANSTAVRCEGNPIQYLTLSHRWTREGMPNLLKANIEQTEQNIILSDLPPVLLHSLMLARHIWINTLCIIQDDPEDWEKEAALMGKVYKNGCLNIVAILGSERNRSALFTQRIPTSIAIPHIALRRYDSRDEYGMYTEAAMQPIKRYPLMTRGWVLRERLWSPRSVYYGNQLCWGCTEMASCEAFPEGLPFECLKPSYKNNFNESFKLRTVLRDGQSGKAFSMKWRCIITKMTAMDLTYDSDLLPALSGLAHDFQDRLDDQYIAGLWRKTIVDDFFQHIVPQFQHTPQYYRSKSPLCHSSSHAT